MAQLIMLRLGNYSFGMQTAAYQELERTREWRWPAQDRIGRAPARQYIGPGDDTMHLSGVIYTTFAGGLGQIGNMAAEAGRGEPLELVDSLGVVWGRWCIERITETHRSFLPGGIPKKIEFTLNLGFYAEE